MRRLAAALVGFALPGAALPAAALPPAPEVGVLVLNPYGQHEELVDSLMARIAPEDGSGQLRRTEPVVTAADFAGCTAPGVEPTGCVRETLAARGAGDIEGPPTVVVLITPAPGFLVGWNCIGVGAGPSDEARQAPGIIWSPGAGDDNARSAAGCILAAAAESGW